MTQEQNAESHTSSEPEVNVRRRGPMSTCVSSSPIRARRSSPTRLRKTKNAGWLVIDGAARRWVVSYLEIQGLTYRGRGCAQPKNPY